VRENDATKVAVPRVRRLRTLAAVCVAVGVLGVAAGCGGADNAATGQSGPVATTQAATAQGPIVSDSKRIVDAALTGVVSRASYGFVEPANQAGRRHPIAASSRSQARRQGTSGRDRRV
jgi:hypothetical protein